MIIDPDEAVFPSNAVGLIRDTMQTIDADLFVTGRQLRETDPNESIGVFPVTWTPHEDSYEMRGGVRGSEPTLQQYVIGIQGCVKDMEETRGLIRHAAMSKIIRTMLYRDPTLAVSLRALSVSAIGGIERTQRYGIRGARYLSSEIEGEWIYLSTLEFWLDTEIA